MKDLSRENAQLHRILDVSRYMATTIDLDRLLTMIVEATCEVLTCERATIFLYDEKKDELFSRVAKGVDGIRFPADRGIAGTAARERVCVNVSDAYADDRFNPEVDKRTGFRTRNILAFPLENLNGDLIGVLQALNKHEHAFDEADEQLAHVLSAQAGVALDRGRLLEEYAEKQRMARDLDIAREIQESLFPGQTPAIGGYELAGWNQPADECGGDSYDFIPLPDGRWAIVLADATGHGIGAALVIAQCHALIRGLLAVTTDLKALCAGVNKVLYADLAADRFVTAFIGILDPAEHRIDYVSCGQAPLVMVSETVETRTAGNVPLSVIDDLDASVEAFAFAPGAVLVLMTDGFYETTNQEREQYGDERVADFIQRKSDLPLPAIIRELNREIELFSANRPPADDRTAVLIRRRPD